ncbi:hypothetical protein G3I76_57200, partial [Streptomyces sp. SID11233]|nr:hypothetical protein [Streptomyces sp. SID11233]
MRAGRRGDWADNPHLVELTSEDREVLSQAVGRPDREALEWAKYRLALDHQRPLVIGEHTETQQRQLALLGNFAT